MSSSVIKLPHKAFKVKSFIIANDGNKKASKKYAPYRFVVTSF